MDPGWLVDAAAARVGETAEAGLHDIECRRPTCR